MEGGHDCVSTVEYEGGITFCQNGKLPKAVAVIKYCTPNALGDLSVTLKDPLVFPKDTVLGDGTGLGGSGVLDEEEIMKLLLEEEEMAEVEWQDSGNFTNQQEHQMRLDEEALIYTLEEESKG
ncbi:hypothetical protein Tco_1440874 [Tanacetum coccineum]